MQQLAEQLTPQPAQTSPQVTAEPAPAQPMSGPDPQALSPAVRFAQTAKAVSDIALSLGLVAPGFMCPPRHPTADRTIRRQPSARKAAPTTNSQTDGPADGLAISYVVAVRVRDRPFAAVQADIIEGVIAVNRLDTCEATKVRTKIWHRLAGELAS